MKAKGPGQGIRPQLPLGVMTVKHCAERLGISKRMVGVVVKSGWLKAWYRFPGSKNAAGITLASIQLFESVDHERIIKQL